MFKSTNYDSVKSRKYELGISFAFGMSRNSLESQADTFRLINGMKYTVDTLNFEKNNLKLSGIAVHLSLGFFYTLGGNWGEIHAGFSQRQMSCMI